MRVDGTRSFAAPREVVWEVLNDPARMAELMPGVESFDVQDDRHWRANVKIPLGLGGLRMSINFEKTDERAPDFAALSAKGNGVGALMNMQTRFDLSEEAGGTSMRWEADVRIAGPVGSMGQRVLQPIVNQQVSNVLNALDRQVMAAKETSAAAAPAQATSTEESANPIAGPAGETTGTAGTPAPSLEAPAFTKPEFYEGPEPAVDPPAPVEWEPQQGASGESTGGGAQSGSRPDPDLGGPAADTSPEADPAEQEGTSGADEGINPWSEQPYTPDPEGPTISTEDPR